jgi:hypothetical protein
MRAVVRVAHLLRGEVGVDLRGAQALVPEEFLHRAQVRTVVEQVGRERVADGVLEVSVVPAVPAVLG